MQTGERAKRLRIYVNEDNQVGHQPAHVAVVGLLKREGAAGATVLRGLEGFGSSGVVHTVNLGDLVEKLPIVIEWIDTPERIDRLLPEARADAAAGPRHRRRHGGDDFQAELAGGLAQAGQRAQLLGHAYEIG